MDWKTGEMNRSYPLLFNLPCLIKKSKHGYSTPDVRIAIRAVTDLSLPFPFIVTPIWQYSLFLKGKQNYDPQLNEIMIGSYSIMDNKLKR